MAEYKLFFTRLIRSGRGEVKIIAPGQSQIRISTTTIPPQAGLILVPGRPARPGIAEPGDWKEGYK